MTLRLTVTTALAALLLTACGKSPTPTSGATAAPPLRPVSFTPGELALFAPLSPVIEARGQPVFEKEAALGRELFYENLLSESHDVSCNSCHSLNAWGVDGRRVSVGHDGRAGSRNAPSVYNAAGQLAQFWDGRAKDVEAQAKGPILNPIEMGMSDSAGVLAHLRASPSYVAAFRGAYPGVLQPVTYDNVGRAIGAFERRLVTPSRWDNFLSGDSAALTPAERQGLRTFLNTGCQACHAGKYLGGDRYMKAGAAVAWFSQTDSGRFAVTHDPNDVLVFKVPSLRNVEKTGPYFNDGSVASLNEAVRLMAHHQLKKDLSPADVQSIVTWLGSLTGELPLRYIAFPQKPS